MQKPLPDSVPGASDLITWFGDWPSFHDAEVLSIHLNRRGESAVVVHTWHRSNQTDDRGFFLRSKDVVVTFFLDRLQNVRLEDFNHQNVLSGLSLEETGTGYRLTLEPCFGSHGALEAERLRITIGPGLPG